MLDREEMERLDSMQESRRETQEQLKERLGSPEALARAIDGGWSARTDAIRMLGYLGRDAEALRLALDEREAAAVIDHALRLLLPTPTELIVRLLTMKKGGASDILRYTLVFGNYLAAEDAIVDCFRKAAARLSRPTIEGFGLAGLRSAAPLLARHARIDRMVTHAEAIASGNGAKHKPAIRRDPELQWDGPSERAIAALVALRRLDAAIDVDAVEALRRQCATRLDRGKTLAGINDWAWLTWVLFDAGQEHCYAELMAAENRYLVDADLGTTLLKRGDTPRFAQWLASLDRRYPPSTGCFCHWPLTDVLHAEGFFADPDRQLRDLYALSRAAGVGPPPWWTWRTPWAPDYHPRLVRGRL